MEKLTLALLLVLAPCARAQFEAGTYRARLAAPGSATLEILDRDQARLHIDLEVDGGAGLESRGDIQGFAPLDKDGSAVYMDHYCRVRLRWLEKKDGRRVTAKGVRVHEAAGCTDHGLRAQFSGEYWR